MRRGAVHCELGGGEARAQQLQPRYSRAAAEGPEGGVEEELIEPRTTIAFTDSQLPSRLEVEQAEGRRARQVPGRRRATSGQADARPVPDDAPVDAVTLADREDRAAT